MFKKAISAAAVMLLPLLAGCPSVSAQQITSTPNIGLQLPAYNSTSWQVPIYYDFQTLDSMFGGLTPVPNMHISGNLKVDGTVTAPNFSITSAQLQTAIGYTPAKNDLSNTTQSVQNTLNNANTAVQPGSSPTLTNLTLSGLSGTGCIQNSTQGGPLTVAPCATGGGGATPSGSQGAVQVAGSNGTLAAATPANITTALGYTPLSSAGGTISGALQIIGSLKLTNLTSSGCLQNDANGNITTAACPSGSASAVGIPQTVQISGSSNAFDGDPTVSIYKADHSFHAAGPKLDVRSSLFALGWTIGNYTQASCAGTGAGISGAAVNTTGYADPTQTYDSTCPIQSAINYAVQYGLAHPGIGFPTVYLPAGSYSIYSPNYTAAITSTYQISIVGDGSIASALVNKSPKATALFYPGQIGTSNGLSGQTPVTLSDFRITGVGHTSLGAGLEILRLTNVHAHNMVISNVGGCSIELDGRAERNEFYNIEINSARRAICTSFTTNETYFRRINVVFSGTDDGGFCYSLVNCGVNGTVPTSGTWYPEPRSLVTLTGVNQHFEESSIKGTQQLSGILWPGTSESLLINNIYVEGFPLSNAPPPENRSFTAIGTPELGHLTAAISASATLAPVDDAIWRSAFIADPAYISSQVDGALFRIVPCDYVAGSTAASTCGNEPSGTTQGTYEDVIGIATADGQIHITARGQDGTTAVAWGVGSAVVDSLFSATYGAATMVSAHLNGTNPTPYSSNYTIGCSDTTRRPLTGFAVSTICADVIVGQEPDGVLEAFPSSTAYVGVGTSVSFVGTSFQNGDADANGNTEPYGEGWVKIPGNGNVSFDTSITQPHNGQWTPSALTAGTYQNFMANVQYINNGRMALGTLHDLGASVTMTPSNNSFTGNFYDYPNNGVLATQEIGNGPICSYSGSYNSTATPLVKTCQSQTGNLRQIYNGSAYVTAPGQAFVYSETSGNSLSSSTLAAAAASTVPGDGVYRASCNSGSNVGDYYTGFDTSAFGLSKIRAQFSNPLPPGVVYGFSVYGYGTDSRTGQGGTGIATFVCNTTAAAITFSGGTVTLTQVQ